MSARSVVVTGCGTGIGRAVFQRLLESGYYVVGIEIDASLADDARAAAVHMGAGDVVQGDAADVATLEAAADRATNFAPLRGWVNNAGLAWSNNLHTPDIASIERVFRVNLFGVFWGCSIAVKRFLAHRQGGAIVNISSIHSTTAFPGYAAYDTAKGGVDALTRYIAVEYGPVGVRANAIAPGAILTAALSKSIAAAPDPAVMQQHFAELHPMGRIGLPEDVAAAVEFFLSDKTSFISGQVLAVDGGATARCFPYAADPGFLEQFKPTASATRNSMTGL